VPLLGAAENITMTITEADRVGRAWSARGRREQRAAAAGPAACRWVSAGLSQPVRELSGGNQQKVTVARALASDPALIVAIAPTRGVDVASKELLLAEARPDHQADRREPAAGQRRAGRPWSSATRVLVLVRGEIFTEFTEPPFDREALIAGGPRGWE